jgi:hypothetical protein
MEDRDFLIVIFRIKKTVNSASKTQSDLFGTNRGFKRNMCKGFSCILQVHVYAKDLGFDRRRGGKRRDL